MADRLLLESGDFQLLETGDKLLLETVPVLQGTGDTVSLTESLTPDLIEQFEQAVGDTVGLTEAQRRQAAKLLAEGLTPSEALTVVANPLDFRIALTAEAALGSAHDFRISLQSVGAPLDGFTIALTSVRALPEFVISLRSMPNVEALFDLDIHRPVGRVEEE